MKKSPSLKKICFGSCAILLLLGIFFYAIAHEQFQYKLNKTDTVTPSGNVGELVSGDVLEQAFTIQEDSLREISLFVQTYARTNTGSLKVSIFSADHALYETSLNLSTFQDNSWITVSLDLIDVAGDALTIRIEPIDCVSGDAVTFATGNSISAGRVEAVLNNVQVATKNGAPVSGMLCMSITSLQTLWFGQYYWAMLAFVVILLAVYGAYLIYCEETGRSCIGLRFLSAMTKYRFLLGQLVDRDFKTKYKRSVLGVFWSFLNPLLTMLVQYVVFSTLFKSDIPDYPVYLLSGIVCFNFFNEVANQCMGSITGNASLITKVYVPKYIYPLSKALSSSINLLLSLIPLAIVILITGVEISASFLLAPFALICLFLFSLGLGMLLATAMVFFRDTQFLWGVLSMLWMYGTPIFYPETIIPDSFMTLYKMNPLYHIVRLFRIVLIDGVSAEPKAYALCLVACLIPLGLGLLVFKRNQDKFVLYI